MKHFFDKTGVMAIATRLRMLSERMAKDSEKIFDLYNVDIKPKWYPIFFSLMDTSEKKTVTQISQEIGHSHVSVVKLVKEMAQAGLLLDCKDEKDGRKTNLFLSAKGKAYAKQMQFQHQDTTHAIEKMLLGMENNLWYALDEFESLLDKRSTYPRVLEEKRKREEKDVQIVPFKEAYAKDFKRLNTQWLEEYFCLEAKDKMVLSYPKEHIIDKGGAIFIALYNKKVVGTCALIKMNDANYDYELSKMSVCKEVRGKHIGLQLGQAVIAYAKEHGSKGLFLETNTVLQPAIALYKKLGFKQIMGYRVSYERCNYQMELPFKDKHEY